MPERDPQASARRATKLLQTRQTPASVVLRDVEHVAGPPVECVRCFCGDLRVERGAGEWVITCWTCLFSWKEKITI